jgi:hypothetical protein
MGWTEPEIRKVIEDSWKLYTEVDRDFPGHVEGFRERRRHSIKQLLDIHYVALDFLD